MEPIIFTKEIIEFINRNDNLIHFTLHRYFESKISKLSHIWTYDDFYEIGKCGLIKAAIAYDPIKATESTFIIKLIMNEINYELRTLSCSSREILFYLHSTDNTNEDGKTYNDIYEDNLQTKKTNNLLNIMAMKECIDKLSNEDKNLISMYFYQELSQYTIAKILNTTQPSVSRNIKKITKKLRKSIMED